MAKAKQSYEYGNDSSYLTLAGDITLDRADKIGYQVLDKIQAIKELAGFVTLDITIELVGGGERV